MSRCARCGRRREAHIMPGHQLAAAGSKACWFTPRDPAWIRLLAWLTKGAHTWPPRP